MKMRRCVLCGLILVFGSSVWAVDEGELADSKSGKSILIGADQLARQLDDKTLRILDVRSESEYAKGHIPGAIRVDVADWKNLADAVGGFRDTQGWSKQLGQIGIEKGTSVSVYGAKLSDTARIWWLLKYVGVKDTSILDGGWEWWVKEERPTETTTSNVAPTKIQPDFQEDRLAEIDSLKKTFSDATIKLVDTRSTEEFQDGRIPGSTHLEWKELLADDGRFKTKTQLRQLFRERGIRPAETAVCY